MQLKPLLKKDVCQSFGDKKGAWLPLWLRSFSLVILFRPALINVSGHCPPKVFEITKAKRNQLQVYLHASV